MIDIWEMMWRNTNDLFKIDERVLIDNETYDILLGVNPFFGIVFRDNMGYPIYNKEICLNGGF